ncbi:thioredoxin 1 [Granulicella rosea]|uniref:Thioredoxin 1 n=1 Tax=Granulicella rosea TaxID=474952 RepID=A0A239GQ92_9BACT|nr:thioredoxin family protein [Granulicella rosea]SNS71396.1 thioredoxin 1 [Granulicella rosea]
MPIAADFVKSVTGETFAALVLASSEPVAVEFMSYGCEHCRLLEPVLQEVAETLGAREAVFRVNIAVDQELADRYEIEGTPTLVMYSGGIEVGRAVGPNPSVKVLWNAVTRPFEEIAS